MRISDGFHVRNAVVALLGAAFVSSGCAHVKQDEFDAEMAQIRQEIRDGDAAARAHADEGLNALGTRVDRLEARMAELEAELDRIEEEFGMEIERLETAIRFNTPVHFDFDESEVRAQDRPVLDRFREVAQQYYPQALITVEGFTDPAGSAAYNLRLGMARAEAVRGYLVDGGMIGEQVRAVSYGETTDRQVRPGAQGPGSVGLPNRRVVLVIDHGGAAPVISEAEGPAGSSGSGS